MIEEFDPTDYSFVVKRRGSPQKPWRWEIYCAGKSTPAESSPVFFESMAEAAKEGMTTPRNTNRRREQYIPISDGCSFSASASNRTA
jgi:hypothetical protein